jgi:hypothetical protein
MLVVETVPKTVEVVLMIVVTVGLALVMVVVEVTVCMLPGTVVVEL